MSMFSEYLRQLIQSRDISISKLSRDSGVERTAIHKALTGGRILPYRSVEQLIYYLKLSPKEAQRLYQYYNQLFESETVSRAWKIIDNIFLGLSNLSGPVTNDLRWFQDATSLYPLYKKNIYKGYGDIARFFQLMAEEEAKHKEPRMELAAPPHMQIIGKCIENLYRKYSTMAISHIICFDASEKEDKYNLYNLECLSHVLPGCILSNQQYNIYYYYSNTVQIQYTDPLPYFLVTHSGVLCLSENFQTAIFLDEKEQIEYFQACFYHLKKACHSLIEYMPRPVMVEKQSIFTNLEKGCSFIMSPPCMMEIPTKKVLSLFTKKKILDFLDNGGYYDFFDGSAVILKEHKRLQLLDSFLEAIQKNKIKGRMVDEMRFVFPENFVVFISVEFGILICAKDGAWGIRIQENNLCRVFYDWSIHFSEGENVLDKERTVEVLSETLRMWQKVE